MSGDTQNRNFGLGTALNSGPWGGGSGSGGPNRPTPPTDQGSKPGASNQQQRPINFEDFVQRGRQTFGGGGGGNGNRPKGAAPDFPVKIVAPIVVLIIFTIWLFNGFYRVETAEKGIVTTFGKLSSITESGLNWHVPWPFQAVQIVDIQRKNKTNIGFDDLGTSRRDVPRESQMITGDQNIIDLDMTVIWRISRPENYLFEITEPEQTVKIAAESALREIIGRTNISDALTTGKDLIQTKTQVLLQETLNNYKAGINIDNVLLQEVRPPREVAEAFNDVQRAIQDRDTLQNEANQYANKLTEEALGKAQAMISQAQGYKEALENQAAGEAQRFTDVATAYAQNPEITRKRIYVEAMQDIFAKRDPVIVESELSTGSLILNLQDQNASTSRIVPVDRKGALNGAFGN